MWRGCKRCAVFEGEGSGGSEATGARWECECKSHVTKNGMMSALDIAAFWGFLGLSKFRLVSGSSDVSCNRRQIFLRILSAKSS